MKETMDGETRLDGHSGWPFLALLLASIIGAVALFILSGVYGSGDAPAMGFFIPACVLTVAFVLLCMGFFNLAPIQASVLSLFGEY